MIVLDGLFNIPIMFSNVRLEMQREGIITYTERFASHHPPVALHPSLFPFKMMSELREEATPATSVKDGREMRRERRLET